MDLAEYASHDAVGLAELVTRKEVTPKELALTAAAANDKVGGAVNAVVELYPDRIEGLDEATLGTGPFRGVPFLIKDVFGHEKGRKIEFGSRLCEGMVVEAGTALVDMLKAAGVNILGRSAAPEYSMAATTESVLHGNTSNPWKPGYSAGGSTGGGMAAVIAGIVPIAHGSDIGGSIRIPASWCGGVGLKPSRMRVSIGPVVDEGGWGYSMNFVQTKTVRDAAAMLDCLSIPQPGDPFIIPKPDEPYAALAARAPRPLRIGIVLDRILGVEVDPEVAAAVEATAKVLADMGHIVETAHVDVDGEAMVRATTDLFFFGFDVRLDAYARRSGRKVGADTLEPVILSIYEAAKAITAERFIAANAAANVARRRLGQFFTRRDIWLSPTTARVAEPWGRYHLSKAGVGWDNLIAELFNAPCQYTTPHNVMGTPAMSLPLAMHSTGLPIGIQIAARPAAEHLLLKLATALEAAMPWRDRVPPLHVSRMT
ncbi:MAG TPA: amidase [Hyphomicrobiaceae bacterium]|nr:amidase [Hyphomicrobiaceae bacterium]